MFLHSFVILVEYIICGGIMKSLYGGIMKSLFKILVLTIILLLAFVGCEEDPVKSNKNPVVNRLEVYLEELYQNEIAVDSLQISLTGDNIDYTKNFTNLESFMTLELNYSSELVKNIKITATLFYNENEKTAYSEYTLSEKNFVIGELRAIYYHQNVILKLNTNPIDEVFVSDFYDYNALDHFFKEYKIENVDAIADAYLATPMLYMYKHRVLYELFDENSVPLAHYSIGDYYNPVFTCNNAFACFHQYIETGNEEFLEWFYSNTDWLLENRDSNGLLRYEFAWHHETADLPLGWTSAMAQGQALAAACMAYHNSGDDKYLQAAHDFFLPMHTNIGTDWNFYIDEEDYLWYEEYPSSDFCHVLNGKLFGMWGLWDYYCLTRDKDALRLFQGAIASILDNYPIWDIDGQDGSRYCLHTSVITDYHRIHKKQLIAYRDMFDINEFDIILNTYTNERNN